MNATLALFLALFLTFASVSAETYNGSHWTLTNSEYNELNNARGDRIYNYTYNYNTIKYETNNCTAQVQGIVSERDYYKNLYTTEQTRANNLVKEYSEYRSNSSAYIAYMRSWLINVTQLEANYVSINADTIEGRSLLNEVASNARSSGSPTFLVLETQTEVPVVVKEPINVGSMSVADARRFEDTVRRLDKTVMIAAFLAVVVMFLPVLLVFKALRSLQALLVALGVGVNSRETEQDKVEVEGTVSEPVVQKDSGLLSRWKEAIIGRETPAVVEETPHQTPALVSRSAGELIGEYADEINELNRKILPPLGDRGGKEK